MNNDILQQLTLQLRRRTVTVNRLSRKLQEHQYTATGLSREIQRITQPVPLFRTIQDTYKTIVWT